jgi:hypothetical protein
MRNSATWVLITDGVEARVCSTADGVTTPLPMPPLALGSNERSRRLFACSLAEFLRDAGREGAYGRLIVVASPLVAGELEEALAPETHALLIGQIVRDADYDDIPESYLSELRH